MARPQLFPKALAATFLAVGAIKLSFGVTAWLAFSASAGGVRQVVSTNLKLSLRPAALGDGLNKAASVAIALNTWLTVPLVALVAFRVLGALLPASGGADGQGKGKGRARRFCERSCILLLCGGLASVVGDFALLMGVVGSLTSTFLTYVFPCSFWLLLHGRRAGPAKCAAVCAIAAVGAAGGAWSLVSSVRALVEKG
jgi:hypothetical protein